MACIKFVYVLCIDTCGMLCVCVFACGIQKAKILPTEYFIFLVSFRSVDKFSLKLRGIFWWRKWMRNWLYNKFFYMMSAWYEYLSLLKWCDFEGLSTFTIHVSSQYCMDGAPRVDEQCLIASGMVICVSLTICLLLIHSNDGFPIGRESL